jgi:hypothetical protein
MAGPPFVDEVIRCSIGGRSSEARRRGLLSPVCHWFTEGFDTPIGNQSVRWWSALDKLPRRER